MAQLNGRVFTRLQQYDALPAELRDEVERLERFLKADQTEIFGWHRTLQLKSVYGVRVRPLLEKIEGWVKHNPAAVGAAQAGGVAWPAGTDLHASQHTSTTPSLAQGFSDPTVGAHIRHAKKLLDALALKGFVTPHKEDSLDDAPSATEHPELKDNDLLAARAHDVTVAKDAALSVWDLVDGAVFAGMLKRKAGLLEPLTHSGKDTYVVVNMRLRSLTLFASDLGREPIAQLAAGSLKVAFDASHYEHGVKVWNEQDSELFDGTSQQESDALVQALLAVGATRDEHADVDHAASAAEQVRDEVKKIAGDEEIAFSSDPHQQQQHQQQQRHGSAVDALIQQDRPIVMSEPDKPQHHNASTQGGPNDNVRHYDLTHGHHQTMHDAHVPQPPGAVTGQTATAKAPPPLTNETAGHLSIDSTTTAKRRLDQPSEPTLMP